MYVRILCSICCIFAYLFGERQRGGWEIEGECALGTQVANLADFAGKFFELFKSRAPNICESRNENITNIDVIWYTRE